jgi:mannose-6-phosphate isomerase class I
MAASKYARGTYDARPVLEIHDIPILEGPDLDNFVASSARNNIFLIDGFLGVDWQAVQRWLQRIPPLASMEVFRMCDALVPEEEIGKQIAPAIGNDDPVFGRLYTGSLEDFFRPESLRALRERVSRGNLLVLGTGAALAHDTLPVVYIDVSKENLQLRSVPPANLGQTQPAPAGFYKRAYFVDWPVLERHRHAIRGRISTWIDANRSERWLGLKGVDLRRAIRGAAQRPFRTKPWFLPGPWGGQFMKGHMGLDSNQPNFAWSYELISPENGVLVGRDSGPVELPFPFMVAQGPSAFLGGKVAQRFGNNFPIRFDYLDTIEGGNLSLQCHPSDEFIHSKFGEPFTQDESYYIHDCRPGATVHLGFREGADLSLFWRTARASQAQGTPMDIAEFINVWPSQKHDMFLIPNGTVHCSGAGNLVLEISATPYIYTFKIYDYLRRDLKGNLRPLHIAYAEQNARRERITSWVRTHLMPQPKVIAQGTDWRELEICNSELLFYAVSRTDFSTRVRLEMRNGVEVVNLVEGEQIEIVSDSGTLTLHYAETAVIPAGTRFYELMNQSKREAKLLKAFVRLTQ